MTQRDYPSSATFDAALFKTVMRKLAGTVVVIGTHDEGGLHGMTATAMCSVSAEPPTILIVVNRTARTHPHIDAKRAFTVNILGETQMALADLFASKAPDPFASVDHLQLEDGCPVIVSAAAYLHCTVDAQFEVGTHTIFIGRVRTAGTAAERPLIYQDTRYGRFAEEP